MTPLDKIVLALIALGCYEIVRSAIAMDMKTVHLRSIRELSSFQELKNMDWGTHLPGWDWEVMNEYVARLCAFASTAYECAEAYEVWNLRLPGRERRGSLNGTFWNKWDHLVHADMSACWDDLHALRRLYDSGLYKERDIAYTVKTRIRLLESKSTLMA